MMKTSKVTSNQPIPAEVELFGEKILDAAFKVHTSLGPGLLESVYEAQLLTYLKLANFRLGYLINFNVAHLRNGFKRMVI
jgi:hypothetical protein